MVSVSRFLEGRLQLRVNREKSVVAPVQERQFLGYRILLDGRLAIAPRSLKRAKRRIREITRRNRGISLEQIMERLDCGTVGEGLVAQVRYSPGSSINEYRLVQGSRSREPF